LLELSTGCTSYPPAQVLYIQNYISSQNIMPLKFSKNLQKSIYAKIFAFESDFKALAQSNKANLVCLGKMFNFIIYVKQNVAYFSTIYSRCLSTNNHARASSNFLCVFLPGYGCPPFCSCLQLKRRSISC